MADYPSTLTTRLLAIGNKEEIVVRKAGLLKHQGLASTTVSAYRLIADSLPKGTKPKDVFVVDEGTRFRVINRKVYPSLAAQAA